MITHEKIGSLSKRKEYLYECLNIKAKKEASKDLEVQTQITDFWKNSEKAQKILKKIKKINIWIRAYEEIEIALGASSRPGIKIDRILLDNFSHAEVAEAVKRYSNEFVLEASGGITLENVRGYGDAGVAFVSMGYITHSVNSLELSLKSTPHVS